MLESAAADLVEEGVDEYSDDQPVSHRHKI